MPEVVSVSNPPDAVSHEGESPERVAAGLERVEHVVKSWNIKKYIHHTQHMPYAKLAGSGAPVTGKHLFFKTTFSAPTPAKPVPVAVHFFFHTFKH